MSSSELRLIIAEDFIYLCVAKFSGDRINCECCRHKDYSLKSNFVDVFVMKSSYGVTIYNTSIENNPQSYFTLFVKIKPFAIHKEIC